eukprot:132741_1
MAEVATELTAHQTLNTQPNDHDANETSSTSCVYLGNAMKDMKMRDKYTTHYRLYMVFPLTLLMMSSYLVCATANTQYTPECDLNATKKICLILFNGIIVSICIAVIIRGKVSNYSLAVYTNALFGLQSLNDLNESDSYDFSLRPYAGLFYLFCILYTAFMSMMHDIFIPTVDVSMLSRMFPAVTTLIFLVLSKRVTCQAHIMKQKQLILTKHPFLTCIEHKIEEMAKESKSNQHLSNRKTELMAICIVVFCNTYITTAVLDWDLWSYGVARIAATTIVYVADCVVMSCICFHLHTIISHYNMPSVIMEVFSSAVHCKDIDDLIGWWELREFYKNCIVQTYFSSLNLIIGACLNSSTVLVAVFFARIISSREMDLDNFVIAEWTCYCVAITFVLTLNASRYYSNQLSHVDTVRREAMGLQRYLMESYCDTTNDKCELMHYIVDQIKEDCESNPHAMRALGVKIDAGLMLFLRASIVTMAVSLVSILSS